MVSLLENIKNPSAAVIAVNSPEKNNSEKDKPALSAEKVSINETTSSEQKNSISKQPEDKSYFNTKTILGTLAGLAVIGTSIYMFKSGKSKEIKNKITPEQIQGEIDTVKEEIAVLKKLIRENYVAKKNTLINKLNEFQEFDYKFPFDNHSQLRSKIESFESTSGKRISNSQNIINNERKTIKDKLSVLSKNPEWKELKLIRKNLRKIISDGNDMEQVKIANEKIPMVNDLLINRVYPEEMEKFSSIYGLEDSQAFEMIRKHYASHENFIKEYDELKNLSIPFDYDIIDRRFSHNGELSLLDVFPDEILSIKSNLELIKSFGIDLKGIKELEKKYVTKLSELTEDFRKSSDIEKLKNLTQRLKELNNTFERTNSKVSKPAA